MTHEQKPESAEFRTREAQIADLAFEISDWKSCDDNEDITIARAHIDEAEARGVAEQRRKDAEGTGPRTRERLVSDLAARLVADGVLVRIAKEIARDHISRAIEEGGIAIDRTNARLEQLIDHTLFRGDDSVFRRIAIEKRRSDNFLSRYTADASNAHRRCPANVAALEARVKELEGALAEVSETDNLGAKPDYHRCPVDQLAFELAWMCDEAELSANDLVIVNREKLKTIARRVVARAAIREGGE